MWRKVSIWTNDDLLLIGSLGARFSAIWKKNSIYHLMKCIQNAIRKMVGISSLSAEACHQALRSRHIGTQPKQVANCDEMWPEKGLPNFRSVHLSTHTSVEISGSLTRTDGRLLRKCVWKDLTNFFRSLKTKIKQAAFTNGESKQPGFLTFGAWVYVNSVR